MIPIELSAFILLHYPMRAATGALHKSHLDILGLLHLHMRDIAFNKELESNFELGVKRTIVIPPNNPGPLAPGHKILVEVHSRDDGIHLLRRVPRRTQPPESIISISEVKSPGEHPEQADHS